VPFIALEWLDGESLDSVVDKRRKANKPPLDLARVVRMMGPVARALECAHKFPGPNGEQFSILHRDLKPENLFLAKLHGQETLKILDFGIGKVRSAATQMVGRVSAEQGGIAAFTPAYGAPEALRPNGAVDRRLGFRAVRGRAAHEPSPVRRRCSRGDGRVHQRAGAADTAHLRGQAPGSRRGCIP
jgi:serine/threonine protein kinase